MVDFFSPYHLETMADFWTASQIIYIVLEIMDSPIDAVSSVIDVIWIKFIYRTHMATCFRTIDKINRFT